MIEPRLLAPETFEHERTIADCDRRREHAGGINWTRSLTAGKL